MGFLFKSKEEKALAESTGGGFERPLGITKIKEKVGEKIKEKREFRGKIKQARKESYEKERLKLAKKEGREAAKQGRGFGGFLSKSHLSGRLSEVKPEPKTSGLMESMLFGSGGSPYATKEKKEKSNMEKLMGL